MKNFLLLAIFCASYFSYAKEWKNLKTYRKTTNVNVLTPSDWLRSDRKKKTSVWHKANMYNLENNLPAEYENIVQRRDFYKWFYSEVSKKGHKVVWPAMSYFISKKLRLTNAFPYRIFLKKDVRTYSNIGSKNVFYRCFPVLKDLFFSDRIVAKEEALKWDKNVLYSEQFKWISGIYSKMNSKTLKKLERIAKGRCLYSLMVPKEIRFTGNLEAAQERFNYAVQKLRPYCIERYH